MLRTSTTIGTVAAGVAAAIGASACCVGPLLLAGLGLGSSLGAGLASLEALQPFFLAATLGFFGLAFYRLYLKRQDCEPGQECAAPVVQHRQRAIFWGAIVLSGAAILFPMYAPI
jgi:mercuric ion transport protein